MLLYHGQWKFRQGIGEVSFFFSLMYLVIEFIKARHGRLGKSVLGLCSARREADVQYGHML